MEAMTLDLFLVGGMPLPTRWIILFLAGVGVVIAGSGLGISWMIWRIERIPAPLRVVAAAVVSLTMLGALIWFGVLLRSSGMN